MYELGITNGLVFLNGAFYRVNVYISAGKIAALSTEEAECSKRVDAAGRYVLPGFIDPHVHFSLGVGANVSKDDFYTGSIEAALGGVTTYIDFLDPVKKAEEIEGEFKKRNELAKHSIVDYSFHTTVANPTDSAEFILEESKRFGINSVKLFTTYADTDRRTYDGMIEQLLTASTKAGVVIVVHAEHDDLIRKDKNILVKDHETSRPAIGETIEVMKLAQMARYTGGRLYIVHVSAGNTIKELAGTYAKELRSHQITLESCPHYFLLNSECLKQEDGYKYTMTPPIRPEEERLLLNQYRDLISTIGTDHCPYTRQQKEHKYTSEIPMGIGGIRYSFLNLYQQYGFDLIDRFTKGPARAYGLSTKGQILPGMDADVVLFDPLGETIVEDEMSVYDGKIFKGRIVTVFARGTAVVNHGQIAAHLGNYIKRGVIE